MTEWITAARELGLLALLLAVGWWLGVHLPKTATWVAQTWLEEQEKNRQLHRDVQSRQDERASALIQAVTSMCRYRQSDEGKQSP